MSDPLTNPSPRSDANAYPEDPNVQRTMDGSATKEVVQKFLARKEPTQPRHPDTGQFQPKR